MRESTLTFMEGFSRSNYDDAKAKGAIQMAFDWDKAAQIIKEKLKEYPDLSAEAGLEGDWEYTGGIIFEFGKPANEEYTYLSSNWATPTLIVTTDVGEESFECFTEENERFNSGSEWDEKSLKILGININ